MDERRAHERYEIWLPVRIEQLSGGLAITHDASKRGVKIVCRNTLEVGSEVTVVFRIPPESPEERQVRGRVVRVSENHRDPKGLWPKLMGIEFDEPNPDLEGLLQTTDSPASTRSPPVGD